MPSLACLNGELSAPEEAKVSIWDRGFLFGDAIYEVMKICHGHCWLADFHYERLARSLVEVEIHGVDMDRLRDQVNHTIQASEIQSGSVYIQITRGVAPRKHSFPDPPVPPTELIVVRPFDPHSVLSLRQDGANVIVHPDKRWKRCDIKTTNLLANVIANEAAHQADCYEAILVDKDGFVTEASHSSLLWVRNGRLEGTPEGPEILPSTTRRYALQLAEQAGIPFAPIRIRLEDLLQADELLLAGTMADVISIVKIDDQVVADGRPGPICRALQNSHQTAFDRWLASL